MEAVDLEKEWTLARAVADALEGYLERDDMIFMPVLVPGPDGPRWRAASLGGFLELLASLRGRAGALPPARRQELEEMGRRVEELRRRREDLYWRKVRREAQSHLNSLRWFLDEVRKREKIDQIAHPGEARHYWQLRLLLDHARANGRAELKDLQQAAKELEGPMKAILAMEDRRSIAQ